MRGRRRGPTPRLVDPRVTQLEAETRRRGSCSGRRRSSRSKKKLPRSWGSPWTTTRPTDACRGRHDAGRDRGAVSERRRVPGGSIAGGAPRSAPHHRGPGRRRRARWVRPRQAVLDVLHSERFIDQSPAEVCHVARGADLPLCPAHDVSRARGGSRNARAARPGPAPYTAPELVATGPRSGRGLKGPIPYRRYVRPLQPLRGGRRAPRECAPGGAPAATCRKQGIAPHQLTIHADRGAPMRSKLGAALLRTGRRAPRRTIRKRSGP